VDDPDSRPISKNALLGESIHLRGELAEKQAGLSGNNGSKFPKANFQEALRRRPKRLILQGSSCQLKRCPRVQIHIEALDDWIAVACDGFQSFSVQNVNGSPSVVDRALHSETAYFLTSGLALVITPTSNVRGERLSSLTIRLIARGK
jgi:hypothetical protein